MATIAFGTAPRGDAPAADHRFAATLAIAMAVIVVAGFSTQLAMGRSTFGSPLRIHAHAVVFMGWVALFLAQTWLATRGPLGDAIYAAVTAGSPGAAVPGLAYPSPPETPLRTGH